MADSDDDYDARKVSFICDEEDEDLLSSATEGAESDGDYHYDGGELHAIDRLKRFWDQRRYRTSTMMLIVIFSLVKALEYLMRENYKSDLRRGVGRASVCSVQFFAQVLSLLASLVISLHQEGSWRFMRRVLWSTRILHFGLLGAMFMFSFWLQISASTRHGPKVWSNIASYSGTVLAPFLSMLYFNRVYGTMQWLCFLMITFALCTFIALRERYSECPAYSDIRCGSRQAVLWIQSNADFAGAGIAFAAISLRIFASILLERLFHTWKDYYAVLKINMDFAACCVAMLGWLLADQITDEATKFQLNSSTFWGTWAAEDYALVAVLAAWFWLSGLMVKQLSTTVWVMFGQLAATTAIFIKDPLSADEHNFGVRLGPSLMLLIIAWMASLMRRTAEVYEDERKMGVVDARKVVVGQEDWAAAASAQTNEIDSMSDKLWHGVCMSSDPLSADELSSGSPWLVCGYDKEDELHHLHKEEEEEEQSSSSGMDTQMLVISLAYAATDTLKTLLNSYALSSSQINVNSMSFLSFLVGLIFASLMTWHAHGLGCSRHSDEESAVEKPQKGLLQAWNFRKILEYSGSSVLQAATMCLSNMAFAFGLSPAMSAVLGKVYTPVLAVGERLILKKRRKTIEWFAVTILTLGTFAFLYLQIYDYEEGLAKAMSNSFPLILCILGACTAAIQALVSQGIYEANRDVDFYMNKVRFDAGSAAFILLAVPLLSLTASRGKDLLWLPRAVNADCDVSQCWPKVPSLAKGGSIHWPWSMEESMMTCTPEACTGSCACHSGLFAGWGLQPELYLFLGVTVLYGILVGIIYDKYGSLHRAKCDAFGLLLVYWVGNPLLNYLTEGTSFHVSLRDECLDIVSFIVPLAALSTDIGKIMTSEMLQKVSAFRMGLFAGLLSRVRGREVVVMFSDPGGAQEEEFQEVIELLDQRAADIRKKGALVRVVDDRDIPEHWLGKLRILFNSNVGKVQQKAYKSLRDLLSDDRIESAPTRVAIGVNSWSRNYHMVALCRHGVSASTAGLSQSSVRSLGIQEIKDCKEAFAKAASMHEKLMKVTKDPVHRNHQTSLEALRDGLKPQEPTPPYVQFISEER
ncbi:unnamed protein product [Symbiodinium sp. CCMP2592]|nr:unnamed protein product [Symbiodinium sp. CCMP2592]